VIIGLPILRRGVTHEQAWALETGVIGMNLSKLLFFGLLSVGLIWIVYSNTQEDRIAEPGIIAFDPGFDGRLALPPREINEALDKGLTAVRTAIEQSAKFKFWSKAGAWLAFAASGAVTLLMGWFAQPDAAKAGNKGAGVPKRTARATAVMAAIASVSTAGGALAGDEAAGLRLRASEQHKLIIEARASLASAKTAEEAKSILQDLELNLLK
jgi:hypothetical protein